VSSNPVFDFNLRLDPISFPDCEKEPPSKSRFLVNECKDGTFGLLDRVRLLLRVLEECNHCGTAFPLHKYFPTQSGLMPLSGDV
jgi:hypothetical protein